MPVLFVGHGSPMNAIQDNAWSRGFASLSKGIPTPAAILAVSAHWYLDGTFVTANARPRTIHDFGGFPPELYRISYPAPGSPALAERVTDLLPTARPSDTWGLDHGTWSVLLRMFPLAQIPVVQLSIDRRLEPTDHAALGRALAPLRDEGVLILGSGNATHNLPDAFARMRSGQTATPDWAQHFDSAVADLTQRHDTNALAALWPDSPNARHCHPTPDHFLPLVYACAAADADDTVSFPITGFDMGSLSMRAVRFG
ncbi:MAG: 4,5-DOPA dioxygenase extradiol [Nitrospirae bacterium]|nr:4,5-DOPA dioxygenase extradiol [Nitrospirota bacterium]